jgi:5-methylcytosine-specific restriction protein A
MLKSCKYCGRIHEASEICEQKEAAITKRMRNRKQTVALSFRRSNAWTNKSLAIRGRDNYLCLCCKAMLLGTQRQYETRDLSVHHITPIEEDYSKRLDDLNLITLCATHHEMCERGDISRDEQRSLVLRSMSEGEVYEEHTIVM